jgi:hypothetical protein
VPSPRRAPLLPKLRGQFAEFLNHSSPDRLGIFYLTTCVGFGYGPRATSLEAFLGSIGSLTSPDTARRHVSPLMPHGFAYVAGYTLTPGISTTWVQLPSCVTPSLTYKPNRSPPAPVQPEGLPGFGRLVVGCSAWALLCGYGNINPLSIDYASRPRLRSRLTQSRLA